MTNAEHAEELLRQALDKIDKDLDPTYQIQEAIKFCRASGADVSDWKKRYCEAVSK